MMLIGVMCAAVEDLTMFSRGKSRLGWRGLFKTVIVGCVLSVSAVLISGCSPDSSSSEEQARHAAAAEAASNPNVSERAAALVKAKNAYSSSSTATPARVVLRVGYENAVGEPFDWGVRRWKEELEARSGGTMTLEIFPSSRLGSKSQILSRIANGENLCTMADGGTYYGLGAYDLGIVFGPYLFKNWDEAFKLSKSKWFQMEADKLAKDKGLRIIPVSWGYGVRHILTRKPVKTMEDLQGLRMRVTDNMVQYKTMEILGAQPITMDLTKVNEALRKGEIDGLENPVSHLYGGGYYKNAPYLLLSSHVYNFTNMIVSEQFWNNLTPSQQTILVESCQRAAKFFNVLEAADEYEAVRKMEAAGVTITVPDAEMLSKLNNSAHAFYVLPEFSNWTPGLYYKVLGAKAIPWSFYSSSKHALAIRERQQARLEAERAAKGNK